MLQISTSLANKPHHVILAVITKQERSKITELIAAMAMRGPLSIVAGSDWMPSYDLTRILRHQTTDVRQVMNRIHVARAFTCYQLLNLLATTGPDPKPLLILDFLHSFYDEDVRPNVRMQKLQQCVACLERLSPSRPIGIFSQYLESKDYLRFHPVISRIADETFQIKEDVGTVMQPGLF